MDVLSGAGPLGVALLAVLAGVLALSFNFASKFMKKGTASSDDPEIIRLKGLVDQLVASADNRELLIKLTAVSEQQADVLRDMSTAIIQISSSLEVLKDRK